MADKAVGKRVSFFRVVDESGMNSGSYQQYCVTSAAGLNFLPDNIPFDIGSTLLVNPLSAYGLLDTIQKRKCKAVVVTAAASQFGRMLNVVCQQSKVQVINIVRKSEQEEILKSQCGSKHILNQTSDTFFEDLK